MENIKEKLQSLLGLKEMIDIRETTYWKDYLNR